MIADVGNVQSDVMRQGVLDPKVPGGNVRSVQMRIHCQKRAGHGSSASDLPGGEDGPREGPVQLRSDEGDSAGSDVAGTGNAIQNISGGRGVQAGGDRRRPLL